MSNYHAMILAARHGRHALQLQRSSSVASRPIMIGSASSSVVGGSSDGSSLLSASSASSPSVLAAAAAARRIPRMGVRSMTGNVIVNTSTYNTGSSHSMALFATAAAASLAVATTSYSYTHSSASCEESNNSNKPLVDGIADESEEQGGETTMVVVQDGMDAGVAGSKSPIKLSSTAQISGPADAEEDTTTNNKNIIVDEEDDDDDPSKDEDTTCSICLINRQGPCRKYWLKFERCMKEHGAEKDRLENGKKQQQQQQQQQQEEMKEEVGIVASSPGDGGVEEVDEGALEEEWDMFMEKSIKPGEDDDDEDEDDEDDDDDEDEEESEDGEANTNESTTNESAPSQEEPPSLSERCDKFMIPWIGCIQEHRNVYSLISNAFYQKDYIDPLEDTITPDNRTKFVRDHAEIGEVDGYVMKFNGVEIDLGNWREHVEADADDVNGDGDGGSDKFEEEDEPLPVKAASTAEEPHLINAYAKFKLNHPTSGNPIEVAYIKDQKGRLLGFDSFSKRDNNQDDTVHEDNESGEDAKDASFAGVTNDGECTFHIVPGETTSIAAYAIYRGEKKKMEDGKDEDDDGGGVREDVLFYTPDVLLPGVQNQK